MKLFINRSMLAQRERERESSLRTSSSLKKSFTLIELSIVLLILSLLVGSLLVGRQIVDRAKIQRIIFEFDYYEKAFHQFYDTYRYVPGALPYKECIKHAEFSGCACGYSSGCRGTSICSHNYDNRTWCSKHTDTISVNGKIVPNTHIGKWGGMFQLKKSKLINEENMPYNSHSSLWQSSRLNFNTRLSANMGHFAVASYDQNINIGFIGYTNIDSAEKNDYLNYKYYAERIKNHNAIIFGLIEHKDSASYSSQSNYGAIPAKITSELDAKIDDGRPNTGKLLAVKSGYAQKATSDNERSSICYDKLASELDGSTLYVTNSNKKYACDVMYVMEDVK